MGRPRLALVAFCAAVLAEVACGQSNSAANASTDASTALDAAIDADSGDTSFPSFDTSEPDIPPNPACPTADYFVTVATPAETRDLRHECGPAGGLTNDTPSMYTYHAHTTEDVVLACSEHSAGPPDYAYMAIARVDSGTPYWDLSWYVNETMYDSQGHLANVNLTRVDPVGGIVEGTFEGDVADMLPSGAPGIFFHVLGSFRVCHVVDVWGE
jgi:hypothetical protein